MDNQQIKDMVVSMMQNVFQTLSKEKQVEQQHLQIRIDLQGLFSNPVFALYKEGKFFQPISMNDIVVAGGGKEYKMIVGVQVASIIRNIFKGAVQQFQVADTKQISVMLFLNVKEENTSPMLGIYKQGQLVDEVPIEVLFEG